MFVIHVYLVTFTANEIEALLSVRNLISAHILEKGGKTRIVGAKVKGTFLFLYITLSSTSWFWLFG